MNELENNLMLFEQTSLGLLIAGQKRLNINESNRVSSEETSMGQAEIKSSIKEGRLRIEVRTGTIAALEVQGELDYATRHKFGAVIESIFSKGVHSIALDLSGLDFIDSSGLGMLIMTRRRIDAEGGKMPVVINDRVERILRTMQLTDYFETMPDLEQAIESIES